MRTPRGILAIVAMAVLGCHAEYRLPPPPTHWATDGANALSTVTVLALNQKLSEYQHKTGHQVIVWIAPELPQGTTIETFGLTAFNEWGIGREGHDDGVVVFWFPRSKKVRIQVGYGLERRLPDSECVRIIRGTMIPRFENGDYDGAIVEGVTEIIRSIER